MSTYVSSREGIKMKKMKSLLGKRRRGRVGGYKEVLKVHIRESGHPVRYSLLFLLLNVPGFQFRNQRYAVGPFEQRIAVGN